jgi:hypothetical protein
MKPKIAKAHSKMHALELVLLGWTLQTEFKVPDANEPYEYLLVWEKDGDPRYPNEDPKNWPQTGVLPKPRTSLKT